MMILITGLNHVTFGVVNLEKSIKFYTELLGGRLKVKWDKGAYITYGELWLALNLTEKNVNNPNRANHIAFDVNLEDYYILRSKLIENRVMEYKENKSEGESYYFKDPDGNNLELHVGNLESRIKAILENRNHNYLVFD